MRRKRKKNRTAAKPPMEMEALRKSKVIRVSFVSGLITVSFLSLILRFGYLQIAHGTELRAAAITNSVATIPALPARGRIYDTNGNLLAYDKPVLSVYYTQIKKVNTTDAEISAVAGVLAPLFHVAPTKVVALIKANQQYSTFRLFPNITDAELGYIGEHQSTLPGISIQADGVREYPNGDLAGQVLGYVGQIPASQVAKYVTEKGYQLNQTVGVAGLEAQYEKYLHGTVGEEIVQVNAKSGIMGEQRYTKSPVLGDNVQLTLDGRLQADAQNAVQQAISQYANQNNSQITDGAAVLIDVKTGGILAMVSYPYLDPNWFINGDFLKHQTYLKTSGAEANNVIQNPHYPGSTVKPANLMTGLESGVVTPNTVYDDVTGPLYIGNYGIREDASYGLVTDQRAIAVSDDKYFYSLGLSMGGWLGSSGYSGGGPLGGNLQRWRDTSFIKGIVKLDEGEMRFGLGVKTGIDLPWEQPGYFYVTNSRLNPAPAVNLNVDEAAASLQKTGQYVNYGSPLDLAFTAFGQMQQFTPMELGQYIATIANDGVRLQPHLLQTVYPPGMSQNLLTSGSEPIDSFQTNVQSNLHLNPQYLKIVQEGLYAAANETDGTAFSVFGNAPYKAAGKTGTAEIVMNGKQINNSVFIGYAPYNHPEIAVAVMVPGAGWGATTAVPIARAMMDDYFKEHHASFFPSKDWEPTTIPANWANSPAAKVPEQTH